MKYALGHMLRKIYEGETVARVLMNVALSQEVISGKVIDIGGGRDPDYFKYLKHEHVSSIEPIDGSLNGINFETDPLPLGDASADTVLMCNILEHIYHYQFLLGEVRRVLKSGGRLVGFVPFWVGYHPDPRDYFRYTQEALTLILHDAGFKNIEVRSVGSSPILANFNTVMLSLPRPLRPLVYLWYRFFDLAFLKLRPQSTRRFPLGFVFIAHA